MHAFLATGKDQISIDYSIPDVLVIVPDKSIKIDQVREIQKFLSRKPIQADHSMVYLLDAHLLTVPAQNALLKTLEEPIGNSQIYLITGHPHLLLPTILSRVQLIKSVTLIEQIADDPVVKQYLSANVSDRLDLLETQGFTRELFGNFLDSLEIYFHKNIISTKNITVDAIYETRKYLLANCNLKLCFSYLATHL